MKRTLIIAEAGVNHNGSLEIARRLIDAACESGADVVKFQTAKLNSLVTRDAPAAGYQKKNMQRELSQAEMLKKLLLPFDAFRELATYCRKAGIAFLSTPFDLESIDLLEEIGCRLWKIPSGEITNLPYLERLAKTGKPVIMSTGMCTLDEVEAAVDVLKENHAGEITLLHCTTQYPAPYCDVNLRAMLTLKERFGCKAGYSDHTMGIEIPVAAVAMGAEVIEKHFTLDRSMEGPDHKASLEPGELKRMVSAIRNVECSLGSGRKEPAASELPNRAVARKSIVAACDIKKGELLTEKNLTTKRPGDGISPMRWHQVLGTAAIRDFVEDERIEL